MLNTEVITNILDTISAVMITPELVGTNRWTWLFDHIRKAAQGFLKHGSLGILGFIVVFPLCFAGTLIIAGELNSRLFGTYPLYDHVWALMGLLSVGCVITIPLIVGIVYVLDHAISGAVTKTLLFAGFLLFLVSRVIAIEHAFSRSTECEPAVKVAAPGD